MAGFVSVMGSGARGLLGEQAIGKRQRREKQWDDRSRPTFSLCSFQPPCSSWQPTRMQAAKIVIECQLVTVPTSTASTALQARAWAGFLSCVSALQARAARLRRARQIEQ